jgi:hypothetical protein
MQCQKSKYWPVQCAVTSSPGLALASSLFTRSVQASRSAFAFWQWELQAASISGLHRHRGQGRQDRHAHPTRPWPGPTGTRGSRGVHSSMATGAFQRDTMGALSLVNLPSLPFKASTGGGLVAGARLWARARGFSRSRSGGNGRERYLGSTGSDMCYSSTRVVLAKRPHWQERIRSDCRIPSEDDERASR